MITEFKNIERCRRFSESTVSKLTAEFEKELDNRNITLVTTGSYARKEASEHSDLDLFVIAKNDPSEVLFEDKEKIENITSIKIKKPVGDTGIFGSGAIESIENMLTNLGGSKDRNDKLTRRMLFLLESAPLYNEQLYQKAKLKLIQRYIKNLQDDQIARFLLNDFIRYYRTISTDFEYKVVEAGKSWGLRNIKLSFSRKLLYFAGILAVAETHGVPAENKASKLYVLLEYPPIERVRVVCGDYANNALSHYDYFLGELCTEEVRRELECDRDQAKEKSIAFRSLKDKSKDFSYALEDTLNAVYEKKHPIHHALLF